MGYPSLASEFPHDNEAISSGATWVCSTLTGPATAELAPHRPVLPAPFVLGVTEEEDEVDVPLDLDFAEGRLRARIHESPAPSEAVVTEEPPGFARFEAALVSALMRQGASRAATLVPRLLRLEPVSVESLSRDVHLTLQSRGYLDSNARYSPKYRELCSAWSAVLRGSSHDFAACGTTTLDRFGADLLAALLAVPTTRSDELRRELRKAGIAAFGVLDAA